MKSNTTQASIELFHLILLDAIGRKMDRTFYAWRITFPVFKAQVWAYLDPDRQAQYDSLEVWDNMVLRVVEALGGGK